MEDKIDEDKMVRGKTVSNKDLIEAPPRDFAALRDMVVERWEVMPKRLTQVAQYALHNPDEVAFGTAASIAAKADVQPSTLVRFAQTLGYQGFSDLQDVFRSRLKDRVLNYDERLAQLREHGLGHSRPSTILEGFAQASIQSLSGLTEKHDPDVMERAVNLLAGAETIYLIGLRRSFPVTSYMAYGLGKLGVRNILVDAVAGLALEQTSFISERDAALAISFTPYASETVALTSTAKDNGAKIVAITDSLFSPLASLSDCWFEVAEADFEGFRSMSATLALAMALTVAIADKRENG
ncbi:sugar isomerase (SIS) [Pelagibacterium lentulum]|uniref:Sugar isomerase (SIS) n=2 Tax=Pelagibacterium lentulum TaxID=2029865 RepID=A0A916RQ19_9HYPH|nr:sugar isomerase (SIS) [Pelagibacterium lentulum]